MCLCYSLVEKNENSFFSVVKYISGVFLKQGFQTDSVISGSCFQPYMCSCTIARPEYSAESSMWAPSWPLGLSACSAVSVHLAAWGEVVEKMKPSEVSTGRRRRQTQIAIRHFGWVVRNVVGFFWSWLLSDTGTGCSERLKNLHLWRTAAALAVTLSNLWLNFKVSSNLEAGPSLGSVGTRWPPEVFCSSKYWVIFLMMFQVSIQSSTMVWISWYLSLCSSLFAVAYGLDNYLFFLVCADLDMVLAFLLSFA